MAESCDCVFFVFFFSFSSSERCCWVSQRYRIHRPHQDRVSFSVLIPVFGAHSQHVQCRRPFCFISALHINPVIKLQHYSRVPGESYRRRLGSLWLYLRYVFRALINSLVCRFYNITRSNCWPKWHWNVTKVNCVRSGVCCKHADLWQTVLCFGMLWAQQVRFTCTDPGKVYLHWSWGANERWLLWVHSKTGSDAGRV